jgi:hypothetical protein
MVIKAYLESVKLEFIWIVLTFTLFGDHLFLFVFLFTRNLIEQALGGCFAAPQIS